MKPAFLLLFLCSASFAQNRPAPPKTIPGSVGVIWSEISDEFVSLADAMPEDKWNFKPSQGEFKDARTFGEQVKHVACANEAWAKQMTGKKPPERCDLGGPSPAKSKAEIMQYLRESVRQTNDSIGSLSAGNLLQPTPGPYWGANRMSEITAATWHISDHYGQLVVYLRMNGIVPPASRPHK